MEKISKGYERKLPALVLTLKDIKDVCDVLRKNIGDYTILIEGYKTNDVDEVSDLEKNMINQLEIKTDSCEKHTTIRVTLGPWFNTIVSDEDDALSIGIVEKIRQILIIKNNKLNFLTNKSVPLIVGLSATLALILLYLACDSVSRILNLSLFIPALLFFLVTVTTGISNYLLSSKYNTIIYLKNKKQNFFQRNIDKIFVGILSTVIGGIAVWLITLFFK